MNGRQSGLLVAGDYGASDDESDSECVPPLQRQDNTFDKNTPSPSTVEQSYVGLHKEVQSVGSTWSVLYDQATGYPYYWNPQTNEVKWDKPPELEVEPTTYDTSAPLEESGGEKEFPTNVSDADRNSRSPSASFSHSFDGQTSKTKPHKITGKSKSTKHLKANVNKNPVFIGPSLPPEPKPEELALQKVKFFEANLASTLISEIENELP
jgi:hypothetical protein